MVLLGLYSTTTEHHMSVAHTIALSFLELKLIG
jgi:hypothetical protein